jgi:hypothetical protein
MSAIISISLKKEDLDKLDPATFIVGKNATYIPLTLFIDDKNDKFKQNVSATISQSEDERKAKKPKTYIGNGKVIYVRDGIKTSKELESAVDEGF